MQPVDPLSLLEEGRPEMKMLRVAEELGEQPKEEREEEKRADELEGACAGELSCRS